MLEPLYFFFELLAFITAVVRYQALKGTRYVYFIPFLFYVIVYEWGSIQNWFSINHSNLWSANINTSIFFLFYSTFLLGLLKTPGFKRVMKWVIVFSVFFLAINMAFFQGFWHLDSATILVQYLTIIVLTCLYFYELLNYSVAQLSITGMPAFWLNTGLLFFCLLNFLFFSSFAYMAYKNNYQYYLLFQSIADISIAILYTCLTVSFLCFRKAEHLPL